MVHDYQFWRPVSQGREVMTPCISLLWTKPGVIQKLLANGLHISRVTYTLHLGLHMVAMSALSSLATWEVFFLRICVIPRMADLCRLWMPHCPGILMRCFKLFSTTSLAPTIIGTTSIFLSYILWHSLLGPTYLLFSSSL